MSRRKLSAEPPADPMGLVALVDDHLAYLESAHYSPHTLRNRRSNLKQFCRWCEERGISRPVEVTRPVLERYRQWLFHFRQDDGRALSWASQCHKLVAVKMYLKWLARSNVLLYNPAAELEMPRQPRRLPAAILTLAEVGRVLATPDVREPFGVRDRAILETLYSTGMRRMEIVGLDLTDVDLERGTVMIRQGKGGKDRMVPIGNRAVAWIERYVLGVRPHLVVPPDDGKLFVNNRGRPYTLKGMTMTCHRLVEASDVHKSCPPAVSSAAPQGGVVSHLPPHLCDADARARRRPALDPADARPRAPGHDRDLHPGLDRPAQEGALKDPSLGAAGAGRCRPG